MNILAIGSHPDDIEGGCFGTLKKYKQQGYTLFYLVISNGEDAGDKKLRQKEALEAGALLKAEVKFGELPSAYLNNNSGRETINLIENAIKVVKPNIIFTHTVHDRHQDHRLVNRATKSACRFWMGNMYFYEGFSSLENFAPNFFCRIDEYFDDKLRALSFYDSQAKKPYMNPDGIRSVAGFRAAQAGYIGRAEAFEVGRIIK